MKSQVTQKVAAAGTMRAAFEILRSYPAIGDFLAYQYLIDLNYSAALNYDEMEFVVAGPGARDGIRKCLGPAATGIESDIIRSINSISRGRPPLWWPAGSPASVDRLPESSCEVDKYDGSPTLISQASAAVPASSSCSSLSPSQSQRGSHPSGG